MLPQLPLSLADVERDHRFTLKVTRFRSEPKGSLEVLERRLRVSNKKAHSSEAVEGSSLMVAIADASSQRQSLS